jgi:hypothetical protein
MVIRIDVHPVGENPTNTSHAFHAQYVYGPRPYIATFCETLIDLDGSTAPEKKGSRHNPQHAGWPTRRFVPSFSPEPTNEAVGVSQAYVGDQLLGLLGP